jgi:CheY-like chemotaxis protein
MDAEKEKCRAAGMNDYLSKPLGEVELKNILLKYLVEFVTPAKQDAEIHTNAFLLQLAGGDKKMAEIILNQVKKELPGEIKKLKKIISEKNIEALPAACHYLISSISPLGNNSSAMQKIAALQKNISDKGDEKEIIKNTAGLITELENTYHNFKQH